MIRSFVLLAICIAASGINGRPQATLPLFNTPILPAITPNRPQPVYLRPNGQMIYLTDGLPMNFGGVPIPKPPMQMPMPMLFPIPGPPRGSFLPFAFWPYSNNQFNYPIISNGLYKHRASTPATLILSESENKTAVPTIIQTEVATESPTAATQSIVDLTSPKPTTASLPIATVEVAQQVTQPSKAKPTSTVPSTSPTSLISPTRKIQSNGDYNFDYSVNNLATGDVKSHEETRLNGVVTGYYMLLEADGTIRKVNYTADADNGFRATVSKIPVPINK